MPTLYRSTILIAVLSASSLLWLPRVAPARGVSTAIVRGTVRTNEGASAEGARVRVVNTATGVAVNSIVANGRFLVHGLDVVGPYVVFRFDPARSPWRRLETESAFQLELALRYRF
jgi:hypothetical protein